jgi:hypothetical protein
MEALMYMTGLRDGRSRSGRMILASLLLMAGFGSGCANIYMDQIPISGSEQRLLVGHH